MYHFAVFGDPISHSRSPEIHQRFGRQLGIEVIYRKIQVKSQDFQRVVTEFFEKGGSGLNVTVPHKLRAYQMAKENSEEAHIARACNTLMPAQTGLYGHNTDGLGLIDDLARLNWTIVDARILILGAGGAVSGCIGPLLLKQPSEIVIANRSVEKAQALAERFDRRVTAMGLSTLDTQGLNFDLVINGISAGLSGNVGVQLSDDGLHQSSTLA